ncbi:hypothetical protein [Pseudofrankia sp. DC12]|uniref:hypothetical protein n=1 Tax=Pseudofrankia sp. DC12 TaxID=683315 RepID=UPI000AFA7445|nr:hypothetical protein [Pseudofrankia sp. DC12]
MSFYSVVPSVVLPGVAGGLAGAGLVALRAGDVAVGRARTAGRRGGGQAPVAERRSLLTLADGARPVGQGDDIVIYRPVLRGVARTYDDGQIRVVGRAADFVRLGLLEAEIDRLLGPDAINRLVGELAAGNDAPAAGPALAADEVAGGQEGDTARVLTRPVLARALILGMVMADTSWDDVLAALFGELAEVPFTACGAVPAGSGFSRARRALPGAVLDELCARLLAAVRGELSGTDGAQALTAGSFRLAGFDGTLVRLPDTADNRALFGAGTDPAPYPHVRLLLDNDAGTKAPLAYAYGPSSGAKDVGEQALLEQVAEAPGLRRPDLLHIGDRNFPGADRLERLAADGMKLLVRLPGGITVRRVGDWLPDGSFLADLGAEKVLAGWRVVEYDVFAGGVHTGETFAVATNVTDPAALSAAQAADAYHARWGATETPLREQKAALHRSGPGSGPMLRATDPFEAAQEIPAWILATSLIRALQRTVAAQATPAARGAHAGQPVLVRALSYKAARHAALRHLGCATAGLPDEIIQTRQRQALHTLGRRRHTLGRGRTRDRAAKSASDFPTARPGITTRKVTYTVRICGPIRNQTPATLSLITNGDHITDSDHMPEQAKAA